MNNQLHQDHSSRRERLFVAIRLPVAVQQSLQMDARLVQNKLDFRKWTDHRDYHITLQFLGDTLVSDIGHLRKALRSAASGFQPFELQFSYWGTFGLEEAPKVLWKGVSGEIEHLFSLQKQIVQATSPLGFEAELRPYAPHITIARKYLGQLPGNENKGVSGVLPEHSTGVNSWMVEDIVLYMTRLGQSPMYEVMDTFTFS
ncbi:RNA 2',3'-cyclic phosphodiesterase [Paenibacillus sp. ClWae2A]|uniref:RNA 2',3'-cyclic phosphodiesterase n=1 Tax=Paenibacillus sp. ClWae2A TaxID=3057177 RepID=UPI0028F6552E|nr:RNA 2',3'-cyclic phosphodiesterase [Paenibacillus sp. ClWae2A]MDT9721360.1 RNA 2',3'-cyclic phosphodiesterase [Paenibacillus sp. ClWae2A]